MNMAAKTVVVAGHVCMDITLPLGGEKVTDIGKILLPGKLFSVGKASVNIGGAVANTGLAMKLFGVEVRLVGKVGNDPFGDMISSGFARHEADKWLIHCGDASSYTIALAIPGIDRILLNHPGANDSFSADDISEELLEGVTLFHFGYPPLMRMMYESDGDELVRLLMKLKHSGIATSMDISMVDPSSEAGRANWQLILEKSMPYVDIFTPSIEELCYMLDRKKLQALRNRAKGHDLCEFIDLDADIRPLAERCLNMGSKLVLVKCGAKGLYYRAAYAKTFLPLAEQLDVDVGMWASSEYFEPSFVPDQILSGTGAGDTSIAAFLAALLKGCPPRTCTRYAAATGACCVSAYDAFSGLKTFDELDAKIYGGWEKI